LLGSVKRTPDDEVGRDLDLAATLAWLLPLDGGEMTAEGTFIEGDEVKQVEMAPGVLRRTLGHGGQMLMAEFELAAGSEVPMHTHTHDQVGYVVRGGLRLTIRDEVRTCMAGDSYYIPGDVPHRGVTVEDALVIDVFAPPREDYLEG
jgi:quercetin dioxygenase-like cupin family protein